MFGFFQDVITLDFHAFLNLLRRLLIKGLALFQGYNPQGQDQLSHWRKKTQLPVKQDNTELILFAKLTLVN